MMLHGFINAGAGDLFAIEGRNQFLLLLGYSIMAIYGAYLWYRTDREEQKLRKEDIIDDKRNDYHS